MIELHDYWRSTASYRVRIALGLAGLEWESLPVDLVAGAQTRVEHLARNPQGLVPVLNIDGHLLTQSLAIVEYLNETRGLGLLPSDAIDRARVRALSHAIAMEIHPICNLRVAKFATSQSEKITMQNWMQTFIRPGLEAFEEMLDGGSYCFGDSVSLADVCLLPQIYNADRWGVDLTNMPKIRRVASHLNQIDAFLQAHPDKTPKS